MGQNKIPKSQESLYKDIQQSLKKITSLCGSEDVNDTSKSLDENDYQTYKEERKKIIQAIELTVKLQEKPFDFSPLYNEIKDKKFWKVIQDNVSRMTKEFFTVAPYRKLDLGTRLDIIKKSFETIYFQRENKKFLAEILEDTALSNAAFEVLMESEFTIICSYISKRRFKIFLSNRICLDDADLEFIWDLYQQNFQTLLTIVSLRNSARIEDRIRFLTNRVDELDDILYSALSQDE